MVVVVVVVVSGVVVVVVWVVRLLQVLRVVVVRVQLVLWPSHSHTHTWLTRWVLLLPWLWLRVGGVLLQEEGVQINRITHTLICCGNQCQGLCS
jgi:hypothetical protein